MPMPQKTTAPSNTYANRWRWWYPAIADWLLRNPGGRTQDCAKELGKHANTISMIMNTDLFRDYMAQRRRDWTALHDDAIRHKLTRVAETSLDILHDSLEKKRDQIPISTLRDIGTSALDRLGYSPNKAAPAVGVVNVQSGPTFVLPVNTDALREAQEAIRLAEARRAAVAAEAAPQLLQQPDVEVPDELSAFVESAVRDLEGPGASPDPAEGFPRTLPSDQ